jgi:hypothetical protein
MNTQGENWEKRFDAKFDLDDYGKSHIVQDMVKDFIRKELQKAREEMEVGLENSAWAKAFEKMIRDDERQRVIEIINKLKVAIAKGEIFTSNAEVSQITLDKALTHITTIK